MQQVSLRFTIMFFFNGQTDVKETFTETNSPIKIPEVITWKVRIYKGKKRVSVVTECICFNFVLKIIMFKQNTMKGSVCTCSRTPLFFEMLI